MATMNDAPLVLVTGVSGFAATWVAYALLRCGYRVRGTVRSLAGKRAEHLAALAPGSRYRLELVVADLLDASSWAAAVRGATYVMHLASPFPVDDPDDEAELVRPAVDGTLNVLRAVADASPRIRRVVLTSSVAAVYHGAGPKAGLRELSDDDWTDLSDRGPTQADMYAKSKTLAERAAWDFVRALPAHKAFELAAVCPGFILGYPLGGGAFSSGEIVRKVLCADFPLVPDMQMPFVDVRDAALVHIAAMTHPAAAGRRFLAVGLNSSIAALGPILAGEFRPLGYPTPRGTMPDLLLRFVGCFDKGAAGAARRLGMRGTRLEPRAAREILGITCSPDLRTMAIATAKGIVGRGLAPDRTRGKTLSTGRTAQEVAEADAPPLPDSFARFRL